MYNAQGLTLDQKRDLCYKAKEVCYNWIVDVFDKNSMTRRLIEMPFDEIMEKLDDDCDFLVLHRDSPPEDFFEIGFRRSVGLNEPHYFLWIRLTPEKAKPLLKDVPRFRR